MQSVVVSLIQYCSLNPINNEQQDNLHTSRTFFIMIFVVFLLLTDPASKNANPACITKKGSNKSLASLQYYAGACNGAHLRSLAPGLQSSEETSQLWQTVGDTVPI